MKLFSSTLVKQLEVNGESLYSDRLVAPKWYWIWKATALFFSIVWRVWDEQTNYRLSVATSYQVVAGIYKEDIKGARWFWL